MLLADWIFIGLIAFFCLLGIIFGFGKGLKFFTTGLFGILIAVLICYTLGGLIYNIGFIQSLLGSLVTAVEGAGGFGEFLLLIRIELIVYYVALFVIVMILRAIIVAIVKNVVESRNVVMKIINKTLGMAFFVCLFLLVALIAFQIIAAIGGATSESVLANLKDSFFKLDIVFQNNPLLEIFKIEVVNEVQIPIEVPVQ